MATQFNITATGTFTAGSTTVPMKATVQLVGGPVSFTLSLDDSGNPDLGISVSDVWTVVTEQLAPCVTLPQIPDGPWGEIFTNEIKPEIYIGPTQDGDGGSAYLSLTYITPAQVGFDNPYKLGPVEVSIEPSFTVNSMMIGYDSQSGLGIKASITVPTQTKSNGQLRDLRANGKALTDADTTGSVTKMVTYPFPLPAQGSKSGFKLNYLGLGQRVGPDPITDTSVTDPLAALFDIIESNFTINDPQTVITTLAQTFYKPDRGWFIAADIEYNAFRIRVLFNDPSLYGLEIVVADDPQTVLSGFQFEILYQKINDNLGLYYGSLNLPSKFRRIPLEAFILILPGFSIWIYTNGDFRLNVGWPISNNSIGISWDVLTGWVGFYIAKLRSSDNPGAQPSVTYNPILALGIGFRLSAGVGFSSGPLSANLSVSATTTMQGLVAWEASNTNIATAPDAYWFAGTYDLQLLVSGAVDFKVIKVSVSISLGFQATIALENGYGTELDVSAHVEAKASVKVLFITVHFSFGTTIHHSFTLASGTDGTALPSGPQASGLTGLVGPSAFQLAQDYVREAMAARETMAPIMRARDDLLVPPERLAPSLRQSYAVRSAESTHAPTATDIETVHQDDDDTSIDVYFVLQTTALYPDSGDPEAAAVALLMTEAPAPGVTATDGQSTGFETLVSNIICWLLNDYAPSTGSDTLADRLKKLEKILGPDSTVFTSDNAFGTALKAFFAKNMSFSIIGVSDTDMPSDLAGGSVLPMFDVLTLTVDDTTHILDSYNPLPANYGQSVDLYFDGLGLFKSDTDAEGSDVDMVAAGDDTPGMASFVFSDTYQALAGKVVADLYQAAKQQQESHTQDLIRGTDQSTAPSLAANAAFLRAMDQQTQLDTLLDEYDYSSAAGFMSRTLLNGLQLPDPSQVPDPVTADNVHTIPVNGLYALTGQLQTVTLTGAALRVDASLTLTDSTTSWISLSTYTSLEQAGTPSGPTSPETPATPVSDPAAATASVAMPETVPPSPQPSWTGLNVAVDGSAALGSIAYNALASVASVDLAFTVRQQQLVIPAEGSQSALINLPAPLMALTVSAPGTQIALHAGENTPQTPTLATVADGSGGSATLVFEIPITQVRNATDIDNSGAEVVGVVPNLYQIGATDDASRDLLEQLLTAAPADISIDLLYASDDGKSLTYDTLDPSVLIARSNLSTQNQVKSGFFMPMLAAQDGTDQGADFATLAADPLAFLRLIWEVSVVNAPGFFLFYRTKDGQDLPSTLFADTAPTSDGQGGTADVPGSSGGTGSLQILVTLSAAQSGTISIPSYSNSVQTSDFVGETVSMAVSDSSGAPVPSWHSAYGPGDLGFRLDWSDPPASDPVAGEIDVDALYSMVQFSVSHPTGSAQTDPSVWSLPLPPVQPDSNTQSQTQAVGTTAAAAAHDAKLKSARLADDPTEQIFQRVFPAYQFLDAGASANVYGLVGADIQTAFRLLDIFGNALPSAGNADQTGAYHDAIVNIGQWPYVAADQLFSLINSAPTLTIDVTFDGTPIQDMLSGTGNTGSGAGSSATQVQSILNAYLRIQSQLTDPNMTVAITSPLLEGQADLPDPTADLTSFVTSIIATISALLAGQQPQQLIDTQTLTVTIDGSTISGLTTDIIPVTVGVQMSRPSDLIAPGVAALIPDAALTLYEVPPQLDVPALQSVAEGGAADGAPQAPTANTNIEPYAIAFETAFANFDGQGAALKFAARAGVVVDNAADLANTLYAVRMSGSSGDSAGIGVSFTKDLSYLALEPLSTAPITRTVDGITYSDVDMDVWSRDCFSIVDTLFTPELAVAISLLDTQNDTTYFTTLSTAKQTLATYVSQTLIPVFAGQEAGDQTAAASQLEAAMLNQLSAAYSVSTITQAKATVSVSGSAGGGGSTPPELVGRFGPPLGSSDQTDGGSPTYTLSDARLDITAGALWTTSLVSLTDPGAQKALELPLEFQPAFVQLGFDDSEEFDGYVPSTWLRFVLPGDDTLTFSITGTDAAEIPIPLPFEPQPPVLQSASGMGTPYSGQPQTFTELMQDLLLWTYEVELTNDLEAQDILYFDAIFGSGDIPPNQQGGPTPRAIDTDIFDAMATVKTAWSAFQPEISTLLDTAFQQTGSSAIDETLKALVDSINGLATAWTPQPELEALLDDGDGPEIIHYGLNMEIDHKTLKIQLRGAIDTANGRQQPSRWPTVKLSDPTLTASIQWTPNPDDAKPSSDGQWWIITDTPASDVSKLPTEFTFAWPGLNMRQQQLGRFESWIVRNAELVSGQETNPDFISMTNVVSFANPTVPQITVTNLTPVTPQQSLQETLTELLTPLILTSDTISAPFVRMKAELRFQVAAPADANGDTDRMYATVPFGLIPNITVLPDSEPLPPPTAEAAAVSDIATAFTQSLGDAYSRYKGGTQGLLLDLEVTLFGTQNGQQLPLVTINPLPLDVSAVSSDWWQPQS